ncbi:MAG TPA: response regulator, partial [Salinarimonas sp.]|nr:response regulator [Salinarimonas sp.]
HSLLAIYLNSDVIRMRCVSNFLFVSGSEFDRLIVCDVLRRALPDAEVKGFSSSEEALEWIESLPKDELPQIILMDLITTTAGGHHLADLIRAIPGCEAIPYIFLCESSPRGVPARLVSSANGLLVERSLDLDQMEKDLEQAISQVVER